MKNWPPVRRHAERYDVRRCGALRYGALRGAVLRCGRAAVWSRSSRKSRKACDSFGRRWSQPEGWLPVRRLAERGGAQRSGVSRCTAVRCVAMRSDAIWSRSSCIYLSAYSSFGGRLGPTHLRKSTRFSRHRTIQLLTDRPSSAARCLARACSDLVTRIYITTRGPNAFTAGPPCPRARHGPALPPHPCAPARAEP